MTAAAQTLGDAYVAWIEARDPKTRAAAWDELVRRVEELKRRETEAGEPEDSEEFWWNK